MDLYLSMKVFERVARLGNFSAAARDLKMSTSAVSRHVADLERTLGVTLLRRTTRRVSQTEAGARYLSRASAIFQEVERLNAEISDVDAAPRGQLRITAPPAIGHEWLAPLAVDFLETYPDIDLELDLTERVVDLVGEGYDAAIRAGPLAASSLIAHRIVELRYMLCASPHYLARRGTPRQPDDIREHDCIHWCSGVNDNQLTFTKKGARVSVPIHGRLLFSSFAAGRDAAVRGLGLTVRPLISLRDDLEAGRLVHVMPDYELEPDTLSLVRPPTPFEPPKVRAFIDFITAALRRRASFDPETLARRGEREPDGRESAASA